MNENQESLDAKGVLDNDTLAFAEIVRNITAEPYRLSIASLKTYNATRCSLEISSGSCEAVGENIKLLRDWSQVSIEKKQEVQGQLWWPERIFTEMYR